MEAKLKNTDSNAYCVILTNRRVTDFEKEKKIIKNVHGGVSFIWQKIMKPS